MLLIETLLPISAGVILLDFILVLSAYFVIAPLAPLAVKLILVQCFQIEPVVADYLADYLVKSFHYIIFWQNAH